MRFTTEVKVETRKLCNSEEGDSQCHLEFFFGVMFLFTGVITLQARTVQLLSFCFYVWQAQRAHQSMKNCEFDDYIFTIPTEVNGKNTTEPEHEDEFEENCITVYVKTISGKTISIKCGKGQKADKVSNENVDPSGYNLPRLPRKSAE